MHYIGRCPRRSRIGGVICCVSLSRQAEDTSDEGELWDVICPEMIRRMFALAWMLLSRRYSNENCVAITMVRSRANAPDVVEVEVAKPLNQRLSADII